MRVLWAGTTVTDISTTYTTTIQTVLDEGCLTITKATGRQQIETTPIKIRLLRCDR
jgi:hypothetical protein